MPDPRGPDPNPARAEAGWPPAVIAGAYQTGVLGMRALIRRGVKAVCFDWDLANPGFRSAYGRAYRCPNPDDQPDAWVEFMIGLARELGTRAVLIPSADVFVSAIATHQKVLSEHFICSPGIAMQGLLATKETQYDLAARHGMPMPKTRFVSSLEEVEAFAAEAHYPCLLKPIHFREWERLPASHPLHRTKIAIAATAAELVKAFHGASLVNHNVILQEIIEGPDTDKRVYCSCYDRNGRRSGGAIFRELRCRPTGFGPASVTEPIDDPETDGVCDRFLRSIGYSGICEIEMKYDSRDGKVKLIEANPRLSGSGDAAPYAGVHLCWLHYLDLIGKEVAPVQADGRDFRHIVLRKDIDTIRAYRQEGLITWGQVVRSYKPPLAFFDFDWRDWRYSAGTLYTAGRSMAAGVVRQFLPKRAPKRV